MQCWEIHAKGLEMRWNGLLIHEQVFLCHDLKFITIVRSNAKTRRTRSAEKTGRHSSNQLNPRMNKI